MGSEKRLAMLEKLTSDENADTFAWYGLALEYQSFGRTDDALRAFKTLRKRDPNYVPMYLMCGTMMANAGKVNEGREWLESGIVKANETGASHAVSELEEALEKLPPPQSLL